MIVAKAGDWTEALINDPPEFLYIRLIKCPGFMSTIRMFRGTILCATGAGIGPCLPFLYQRENWPQVKKIIWISKSPERTYGEEISRELLSSSLVIHHNTDTDGRPDIAALIYHHFRQLLEEDESLEAVHIVSNEPVTRKVVDLCDDVGIVCLGAIWDS
eukprot:g3252.t1